VVIKAEGNDAPHSWLRLYPLAVTMLAEAREYYERMIATTRNTPARWCCQARRIPSGRHHEAAFYRTGKIVIIKPER
jgi:hypothetical protein